MSDRFANNAVWADCPTNQLCTVSLETAGIEVKVQVIRGEKPGPTLAVLGCVHGDEYEGPVAIAELLRTLDHESVSGTLVTIPVCNPPAYEAGTRTSPLDNGNLARCFPGNPEGSPTERLAWLLGDEVISRCDALIDLHSAGVKSNMALLVGYGDVDGELGQRSRDLAIAFGAPVLWAHPEISPGRTLSTAIEYGVPCIYAEASGGGGAPEEAVQTYREGIERVMMALGMQPGTIPAPRHRHEWFGSGDTDTSVSAVTDGLFRSSLEPGDGVNSDDLVGEILDFGGSTLAVLRAPAAGVIVLIRRTPMVRAGDPLYLLTTPVAKGSK